MKQNRLFKYAMLLAWMVCSFVGAGCSEDEEPGYRIPILSVNETPSNLTHSSATLIGFAELFERAVDQCGFIVHSTKGILEKEGIYESAAYTAVISSDCTVTLDLTDLEAETTYYYCLFVKAGKTVLKSDISEFKTNPIGTPTFYEISFYATEEKIDLACGVLDDGGKSMTDFGFEYRLATEQTYTKRVTVNQYVEDYIPDKRFTAVISVEPGTAYCIRAYGSNGYKEGFSKEVYVETPAKTSPTVSLLKFEEDNIGVNYCKVSGKIENTGGSEVTERGFIYSRFSDLVLGGEDVTQVPVDVQTSLFSAELQGLQASTTYYVRAYAANKPYGTTQYGYSAVQEFTTASILETPEVSSVSSKEATVKSSIADVGEGTLVKKGFFWGTDSLNLSLENCIGQKELTAEEDFQYTLSDLSEGTRYYVKAYAVREVNGRTLISSSSSAEFKTKRMPVDDENPYPEKII